MQQYIRRLIFYSLLFKTFLLCNCIYYHLFPSKEYVIGCEVFFPYSYFDNSRIIRHFYTNYCSSTFFIGQNLDNSEKLTSNEPFRIEVWLCDDNVKYCSRLYNINCLQLLNFFRLFFPVFEDITPFLDKILTKILLKQNLGLWEAVSYKPYSRASIAWFFDKFQNMPRIFGLPCITILYRFKNFYLKKKSWNTK